MFSLIAAVADNGCIGSQNRIPWNIPEDFQYFKKITLGKTCLMGQATFESILGYLGKPLPGRKTVVLSRDPNFQAPHEVQVFDDLDKAWEALKNEDIFVCGGASIYKQTINRVDVLYITEVHIKPDGDVFFPEIDKNILQGVGVAEIYPEVSPLYTTDSHTLILKLPGLGAEGVLTDVYDYVVIARDADKNNILRKKVFPDAQSTRKSEDLVLTTILDAIDFSYLNKSGGSVNPNLATSISTVLAVKSGNELINSKRSSTTVTTLRNAL